ncbi:hypothetical protein [Corynebacterium sp. UMB9976]|uniref:hypothetical protein n=1 Tax=Corynebacterium sp. UMB9976 TaxID=3046354 RepID=UPI00254A429C|nr:hypothetical protein [Corynebacterium sp. UMB9976]
MEDQNVKSQKSTVVRGALAIVAAGAALGMTACSAGQITQTAEQAPAVNGLHAKEGNVDVADVSVVLGADGKPSLKFTASNAENDGKDLKLVSASVDGQAVSLNETIKPGCNLVVDREDALKDLEKGAKDQKCLSYAAGDVSGVKDLYVGGQKPVEIKFDDAEFSLNAPVVAYTPEAGAFDRDKDGQPTDK